VPPDTQDDSLVLTAFSREQERRRAAGLPATTYGQFLDSTARRLEDGGDTQRARHLRDLLTGQQAAGESFGQVVERAAAAAPDEREAASLRGVRAREQARVLPQTEATAASATAAATPGPALKAAESTILGAEAFADTASAGLSRRLESSLQGPGTDLFGLQAEQLGGRKGADVMEAGRGALREDTGAAGFVAEKAGEALGFLVPAGAVGKAGKALQVTAKSRPIVNLLGRAMTSKILSFPIAGAALRGARSGQEAAFGDTGDAMTTLRSIPAGAAQDTLVGLASVPFRFLGAAVERGVMKGLMPSPRLASAFGKTIAEMPARDIPAAIAAKALGGAVEFAPFSYVPNLVDPHDPTQLSPDAQVFFNPSRWGSDAWKVAGANIYAETLRHAAEEGLKGAAVGALVGTLGGHPLSRPGGDAAEAKLRNLTTDEWRSIHGDLVEQIGKMADNPEAAEPLLKFLAESQRLKESVAKLRGDVPADLADFRRRVGDWVRTQGVADGSIKEPAGSGEAPNVPPASEGGPGSAEEAAQAEREKQAGLGNGPGLNQPVEPVAPPVVPVEPQAGTEPAPVAPPAPEGAKPPAPGLGKGPEQIAPPTPAEIQKKRSRRLLEKAKEERRKANTDALTGLSNRAAFDTAIAREVPKGAEVALLDVRGLKGVNDALGQEAGDKLIRQAAAIVEASSAGMGNPAGRRGAFRIGGDEFAIIAPKEVLDRVEALVGKGTPVSGTMTRGAKVEQHAVAFHFGRGKDYTSASEALAASKQRNKKGASGGGERAPEKPAGARTEEAPKGGAPPGGVAPTTPKGPAVPEPDAKHEPLKPHAEGNEVSIPVPGAEPVKARYAIVDRSELLPSHDATKGFLPNDRYPTANRLQERRYDTDALEQGKVEDIARNLNPEELLNTSPRATEGPPTITRAGGVVVNGNGRSMALQSASPEVLARYREALAARAQHFGISAEALKGAKDPVLVRIVDMDPTSKAAAEFGRRGNVTATQSLGPLDRAARVSDLVPDDVMNALTNDRDVTFSEAVIDVSRGRAFRKALEEALPTTERAEFFKDSGELTDAGKELARNVLLTKSIGPDAAREIPPHLRRTLSESAVQLAQLRREPHNAPVYDAFIDAVAHYRETLRGGEISPEDAFDQPSLITPAPISEAGRTLLDFLYATRESPKKMRDGLRRLLELRAQEGGMLGDEPAAATARRALVKPGKGGEIVATPSELTGVDRTDGEGLTALTAAQRGRMDPPDATLDMPLRLLPEASIEMTPAFRGERVGRHQVIDALANAGDVPIRLERMGKYRKKALGIFKVRPEVVRVRDSKDIPVAAHEVGHATEKLIWPELVLDPRYKTAKGKRGIRQELLDLGKALYGKRKPANGYESEGWAEFIRHYVTEPSHLETAAPQAFDWFEKTFLERNPKLKKGLLLARDLHEQYRSQGVENRGLADMRSKADGILKSLRAAVGRKEWIEEFAAIEDAVRAATEKGHVLAPRQNPEILAKVFRGAGDAVVSEWILGKQRDLTNNVVGPGLNDIFIEADAGEGEASAAFGLYLAAKRSVWLLDPMRGGKRDPGMTASDAKGLVAKYEGDPAQGVKWQLAASKIHEWHENLLNYLVQAGVMDSVEKERIVAKSPFYVPLQRYIEGLGAGGIQDVLSGKPLRGLKGSSRQFRDIREAMISNATGLVKYAHKRMVLDAILRLGRLQGMGEYVEAVPKELVHKLKPMETFREQLEEAGADLSGVDPDMLLEWFEPKQFPGIKDPILPVRDANGDVTWYQVSPGLYESLKGLDYARWKNPLAHYLLESPAAAFRAGATGYRATFGLWTNPLRDFQTFVVQSSETNPAKALSLWLKHTGSAYKAFLTGKENPYADLFRAQGGVMSQPLGVDARSTQRLARSLGKSGIGRVLSTPGDAAAWVREAFQVSEGAPRAAEMEAIGNRLGWDPSKPLDLDTMLLMLKGGREVTTDFMAGGRAAKFLNRMVPFFNQAFQSPRAFARAFKRDPAGTALKGTLSITLPTLWLWWKNKDEDWYRDMPAREKFLYFHVAAGKQRVRIPRGFETGYGFSVLPEAIADAYYRKDPEQVRAALAHVFENVNPAPVQPTLGRGFTPKVKLSSAGLPVLAGEAAQQLAGSGGFDDYFEQPIVPRGEQERPASEQRGPYTTGAARVLGSALGWSPRRIDHALSGVFAGLGQDIPRAADTAVRLATGGGVNVTGRDLEPTDIPIVGPAFAQGGVEGVGSAAVQRVYEQLAFAREREASIDDPESSSERSRRLQLTDAATALKLLRLAQRDAKSLDERQQLQRETRRVAQEALKEERVNADRMQMGREERFVREIGDRLAAMQHATDGDRAFKDLTLPRRAEFRDRFQREIEDLAKQYAELRGMKWTGRLGDLFPKLEARIEIAKDAERRKPPHLPGPEVGVPPSDASFRVLDEESLPPAKRGRRILAPASGPPGR
jgi:GGDEF domain-containing protein